MSTYLITGGSRGIGFGFCQRLSREEPTKVSKIIAAARTETNQLRDLIKQSAGRVEFLQVDVTSEESIQAIVTKVEESLGGSGLDVLINNAGIMPHTPDGIAAMNDLMEVFKVNVLGVQFLTKHLFPLLQKGQGKKIFNISSPAGSISLAPKLQEFGVRAPAYEISKAALNRLTAQYAVEYKDQGFVVLAISPGWVVTDLGGEDADIDVETSVNAMLSIMERSTLEDTGKFFNIHIPGWEHAEGLNQYDGAEIPW